MSVRERQAGGEKDKVFVTEVPVKRYGSAYGRKGETRWK